MAIQFTNKSIDTGILKYTILDSDNQEVGEIEGGVTDAKFICNLNIDKKYQNLGYGFEAFEKMYNEINLLQTIKVIEGSWHKSPLFKDLPGGMSINLRVFLEKKQIKSSIESAFLTPTGRWVKKLGFTQCSIITDSPEHVVVNFTK